MRLLDDNMDGVRVLDLVDWQQPTELARYDTLGPDGRLGAVIQDMQLVDRHLYLAFWQGSVSVLDVSRPHDPVVVGHIVPDFGPEGGVVELHGLVLAQDFVFLAGDPGGLMVLQTRQK